MIVTWIVALVLALLSGGGRYEHSGQQGVPLGVYSLKLQSVTVGPVPDHAAVWVGVENSRGAWLQVGLAFGSTLVLEARVTPVLYVERTGGEIGIVREVPLGRRVSVQVGCTNSKCWVGANGRVLMRAYVPNYVTWAGVEVYDYGPSVSHVVGYINSTRRSV